MDPAQIVSVWSIYLNLPFRAETSWLSTVRDEARGASSIHSSSRARCLNLTLCIWYDLFFICVFLHLFQRYFARGFKEFLLIFRYCLHFTGSRFLWHYLFLWRRELEYNLKSVLEICCMYCLDRREFGNWDQAKRSRHVENFFFLCLSFDLPLCTPFFLARRSRVSLSLCFIAAFALRFATFHILFTVNYIAKICRSLKMRCGIVSWS